MKDLKIYIFIASILLVVYIMAQYNKPQPLDWTETYRDNDKMPFGTYILHDRLADVFPGAQVVDYREPAYNTIVDNGSRKAAYVIICESTVINEYDFNKLSKFIKQGNNVFIAASNFGQYLEKKLKFKTGWVFDKTNALTFSNKKLGDEVFPTDKNSGSGFFREIDTASTIVLGKNQKDDANFIKFSLGKGALYLNTNPLLFTNYNLLQPKGAKYAGTALSYMQPARWVLWDQYYTQGRAGDESLMRVFLRNTQLKWAFYIAVFSLLIFIAYEIKRRQRIIPVIEPLTNTTVEFTKTVGMVYYEQRDNSNIAQKKATYFLEYVRTHYYLKTTVLNDEFTIALTQKSGAESALVKRLIAQIILIKNNQSVSDSELIELNQNIEKFYSQSR
ncbi:DUF4350 domain-containing protein [Mucilaginibacter sp. KACC 22063]|uniref:DUF4350 domain-containing protein n=1 Tax=Mucilaginibacter sp. KACC 22063 TaxID=3025666 RepID=UPI0023661C42|nr:DUF4350 domain-containing protein [Mucilaginibacter sp. KACC 22063]WDF56060.1 DUF4350 domain-containing protein [Mucilaginibacter sp. KACC 22063]